MTIMESFKGKRCFVSLKGDGYDIRGIKVVAEQGSMILLEYPEDFGGGEVWTSIDIIGRIWEDKWYEIPEDDVVAGSGNNQLTEISKGYSASGNIDK